MDFFLVASKSKNIKPDYERDERAEQFALCSLLFELKFPNAIALFSIVGPQTSKTRQHRRHHVAQQTNVRFRHAAVQHWAARPRPAKAVAESRPANPSGFGSKPQTVTLI